MGSRSLFAAEYAEGTSDQRTKYSGQLRALYDTVIDAEYNAGDFYRIMEGLRHVILERSISEEVLCYEGDIKILLQRELSAVSRLNEMTNGDEFLFLLSADL